MGKTVTDTFTLKNERSLALSVSGLKDKVGGLESELAIFKKALEKANQKIIKYEALLVRKNVKLPPEIDETTGLPYLPLANI